MGRRTRRGTRRDHPGYVGGPTCPRCHEEATEGGAGWAACRHGHVFSPQRWLARAEQREQEVERLCPYCKCPLDRGYCGTCNATWWTYVASSAGPTQEQPDGWLIEWRWLDTKQYNGWQRGRTFDNEADAKLELEQFGRFPDEEARTVALYRRTPDSPAAQPLYDRSVQQMTESWMEVWNLCLELGMQMPGREATGCNAVLAFIRNRGAQQSSDEAPPRGP